MINLYRKILLLLSYSTSAILEVPEPWHPRVDPMILTNHSMVFKPVTDPLFRTRIINAVDLALNAQPGGKSIGHLFQWLFITGFRESSTRNAGAWLIIGGVVPRRNATSSEPFVSEATGVIGCRLNTSEESGAAFHLTSCFSLQTSLISSSSPPGDTDTEIRAGLLGMGLSSLQLRAPADGAVLVYCDPLWRVADLHPGGICRIRLRQHGTWRTLDTNTETSDLIEFCTVSDHSQPCGGGFSIDLLQLDQSTNGNGDSRGDATPKVDMLVGLPFKQPSGEVHLLRNILQNFDGVLQKPTTLSSSVRILGDDNNFGSKVRFLSSLGEEESDWLKSQSNEPKLAQTSTTGDTFSETLAVISSPSGANGSKIVAFRLSGDQAFRLDPNAKQLDMYEGFGQSMVTIRLPPPPVSKFTHALVIGSPFESSSDNGPNVGRVYISCPTSGEVSIRPAINGSHAHGFFGYSLARVGDVDGDGIHDVAIGAPALQKPTDSRSTAPGRVYIHRVTPACSIDPVPIQILEAPDSHPGDGFGLDIADNVDIDYDGWPELLVTSLNRDTAPYIFTMPKRLVAQCHISVPLSHTLNPFQAGSVIPVRILARLFDPRLKRWAPIPLGVVSQTARVHQVNPDVLWQQRHSTGPDTATNEELYEDSMFLSLMGMSMNRSEPRFLLAHGTVQPELLSHDPQQLSVKFSIQSRYGSQSSDLITIPLRVAYRSVVNTQVCTDFLAHGGVCSKRQQPIVDWSQCETNLQLARHICIPAPECIGNLALILQEANNSSSPASDKIIRFQWGRATDRHQTVQIALINLGPTKSAGLLVQIRVTGRSTAQPAVGINLHLTQVTVLRSTKGASESSRPEVNLMNTNKWTVQLHPDGLAALISSKSHEWMYPNETMLMRIDLFASISTESQPVPQLSAAELERNTSSDDGGYIPSLHVRVLSDTKDPDTEDNELTIPYGLSYAPRIDISAGSQPPTLIDNRKEPTLFHQKLHRRRVLSGEIGPKIQHTFLIENTGKFSLSNVTFLLEIPITTTNGQPLVYLSRQSRRKAFSSADVLAFAWQPVLPRIIASDGSERGSCLVPEDVLDPFGLHILDVERDDHLEPDVRTDRLYRSKRHSSADIVISRMDEWIEPDHQKHSASAQALFERTRRGRINLRCPNKVTAKRLDDLQRSTAGPGEAVKCTAIHCRLDRLDQHDTVRLEWVGWLWSETFFNLHTPDVQLVSRLRVENWGELPPLITNYKRIQSIRRNMPAVVLFDYPDPTPSYEMTQSIVFRAVQPEHRHMVPLWPIIVGVVVGCLLLMALGVCCYASGFFRRKSLQKRLQDREAKQQLKKRHRNSEAEVPLLKETQVKTTTRVSSRTNKDAASDVPQKIAVPVSEATPREC
ncbi:unnamed protein product [Dicrocoelium dendriticum]|nr:unnamed protein product [Dicrocoelium dendriticum]